MILRSPIPFRGTLSLEVPPRGVPTLKIEVPTPYYFNEDAQNLFDVRV